MRVHCQSVGAGVRRATQTTWSRSHAARWGVALTGPLQWARTLAAAAEARGSRGLDCAELRAEGGGRSSHRLPSRAIRVPQDSSSASRAGMAGAALGRSPPVAPACTGVMLLAPWAVPLAAPGGGGEPTAVHPGTGGLPYEQLDSARQATHGGSGGGLLGESNEHPGWVREGG